MLFLPGERDIFGEALSDSDEEAGNINIMDMDEDMSHLTNDDSRLSDTNSLMVISSLLGKILFLTVLINCKYRKKSLQFLEPKSLSRNSLKKCLYLMIIHYQK